MYPLDSQNKFRRLRQNSNEHSHLEDKSESELIAYQKLMQNLHDQVSWTRRQLNYIAFNLEYRVEYELRRGEVYEFDWGLNVHAELSQRHYGVVLLDSYANNDIVVVVPLKTRHHEPNPMSDVNIGKLHNVTEDKETLAVINQIRGLDKLRIYQKGLIKDGSLNKDRGPITILNEKQMDKIVAGINQLLIEGRTVIQ
ncbi:MAG TPA: type II toxin-antitoxin system PemK/MazF family toxin [Bacilli bacterium]|nr:type II toxin-antitoxin system PemK/MazF family toxin [Bacilli bacterium]